MSEVYNAMGRINRISVLCIDAYGVAVKNGFEGTVEEWLESLKGEKGEKGDKGDKGEKGDPGNGASSWNDLTDKPFGEVLSDTLRVPAMDEETIMSLLGDLVAEAFLKVSNTVLTMEDFKNGFSASFAGEKFEIPSEAVPEVVIDIGGALLIAEQFLSVSEQMVGVDIEEGLAFPSSGTYLMVYSLLNGDVELTVPNCEFASIKPLDEMYMPKGYKNIQADWEQTDETAMDYIKNKPITPEVKELRVLHEGNVLYLTETHGGEKMSTARFEEILNEYKKENICVYNPPGVHPVVGTCKFDDTYYGVGTLNMTNNGHGGEWGFVTCYTAEYTG